MHGKPKSFPFDGLFLFWNPNHCRRKYATFSILYAAKGSENLEIEDRMLYICRALRWMKPSLRSRYCLQERQKHGFWDLWCVACRTTPEIKKNIQDIRRTPSDFSQYLTTYVWVKVRGKTLKYSNVRGLSEANQAVTTRVLHTKADRKSSVEIKMNPHPAHSKLYSEELLPDVFLLMKTFDWERFSTNWPTAG